MQHIQAKASVFAFWIMGVLLGSYLAYGLGWGVPGLWGALAAGECPLVIFYSYHIQHVDWKERTASVRLRAMDNDTEIDSDTASSGRSFIATARRTDSKDHSDDDLTPPTSPGTSISSSYAEDRTEYGFPPSPAELAYDDEPPGELPAAVSGCAPAPSASDAADGSDPVVFGSAGAVGTDRQMSAQRPVAGGGGSEPVTCNCYSSSRAAAAGYGMVGDGDGGTTGEVGEKDIEGVVVEASGGGSEKAGVRSLGAVVAMGHRYVELVPKRLSAAMASSSGCNEVSRQTCAGRCSVVGDGTSSSLNERSRLLPV